VAPLLVRRRFAPIDVALLPIGAYEPRWFMRRQHMNPPEAYRAFLDLKARYMLSLHWGTFDLTDEPLDLPPRALEEVLRGEGGDPLRARSLAIGERWELPARATSAPRRASSRQTATSAPSDRPRDPAPRELTAPQTGG
jgi:N-acyl-phosphatidylethanolamine-hydrolysing phospholipase D